jgi:7-keto-8-aminopelargonate synthetase-like enzyme
VFPQSGWPAANVGGDVIRVGTLSKALGSQGGFVVADAAIIDLLVNIARPFIFTTAMSPPAAAAGLAALAISQSVEGDERRAHLRRLIDMVRPGHPSPILPIVLGDEKRALAASEALYAKGFLVPAIRPPTVGPGTSRLRISLSAAHEEHTVEALLETLDTLDIPW